VFKVAGVFADGKLSGREIREVFKADFDKAQKLSQYKYFLLIAGVFTLVIIGANVGLSIAAAVLSKDTSTRSDGVQLVKGTDNMPVATGLVVDDFVLADSYNYPEEIIRDVSKITTTGADGVNHVYRVTETAFVANQWVDYDTASGVSVSVDANGVRVYNSTGGLVLVTDAKIATAATGGNRRRMIDNTPTGSSKGSRQISVPIVKSGSKPTTATPATLTTPGSPDNPKTVADCGPCTQFCIRGYACLREIILDKAGKGTCSIGCKPKTALT
jgi:hypothetical protein